MKNIKRNLFSLCLLFSLAFFSPVHAQQVMGSWFDHVCSCVKTIEKSDGEYYMMEKGYVYEDLRKESDTIFFSKNSTANDHFIIEKNGDLTLMDKDGVIDFLPKVKK